MCNENIRADQLGGYQQITFLLFIRYKPQILIKSNVPDSFEFGKYKILMKNHKIDKKIWLRPVEWTENVEQFRLKITISINICKSFNYKIFKLKSFFNTILAVNKFQVLIRLCGCAGWSAPYRSPNPKAWTYLNTSMLIFSFHIAPDSNVLCPLYRQLSTIYEFSWRKMLEKSF